MLSLTTFNNPAWHHISKPSIDHHLAHHYLTLGLSAVRRSIGRGSRKRGLFEGILPLSAVRHRRVVQVDAHLAVVVALVAEGVLDAHLVARRRAVEVDLVVAEGDVLPALATVDSPM